MKPTLAWAKRNLKAVNKLIGQYKEGKHEHDINKCPLCIACKHKCLKCPWVVFRGYVCYGVVLDKKGEEISRVPYQYMDDSVPLRLRRLYGWKVRFKNMIRKFEEETK